jgi:hypothetical protein
MSNSSPTEEETSEYEEAKEMSADCLGARQLGNPHLRCSTHKWAFDTVEKEYLNDHDD